MLIIKFILLLSGLGLVLSGPTNVRKFTKEKVEQLCARMHNNTAFLGAEPFARLLVDSASKCQKSCMELHPKCTAVVFYYVFGEKERHICFLFDRNSVNENVALVPEKPKNHKDVIRALEIVSNCHEFDPFPPLLDPFVVSSDVVGRDKRAIGFNKPVPPTGPWSRWSPCNHASTQIRSQTCEYGRIIQKRQCAPKYPHLTQSVYNPAHSAPHDTPYPPDGYAHPSHSSDDYQRIMGEHKKQELQLCCYKLQHEPGAPANQVHAAVPSASPCPAECAHEVLGEIGSITPNPLLGHGFRQWGDWSPCSVTCGRGIERRIRACSVANCIGPSVETRDCERSPCAGNWNQWCEWSPCSVTCGLGKKERSRYCDVHGRCEGLDHEEMPCNQMPCPEWLQWSEWAMCSVSCGGGVSTRFRTCPGGDNCPGSPVEEMRCNEQPCPCWGEWTTFTGCSVTCGEGTKTRSRFCENGNTCEGDAIDVMPCKMQPCAEWLAWEQWGTCSVTCGEGTRTRTRQCTGSSECVGERVEQSACFMSACPSWLQWQEWTSCSVTCGQGIQMRKRYCSTFGCSGSNQETKDCFLPSCATWGQWEEWTSCSVTCGTGTKLRRRNCIGGNYCEGQAIQNEQCNMAECPFWSDWGPWSRCSVTCGEGVETRKRYCTGAHCLGTAEENRPCRQASCASWESWGPWSQCSATCGPGQKSRARDCVMQFTGSEECPGSREETVHCDAGPCCQWSDWCGWSVCDRDCGGGKKIRQRFCQRPGLNGEFTTDSSCVCQGSDKEIQDCNQQTCPPQCNWSTWCPWSRCGDSKDPCKNATMTRTRQCVGEAGCRCYGFAEEKQFCRREAVCDPPIISTPGVRRRRRAELRDTE